MNDQLNQSGQLFNSQDSCQTNSQRYDGFTTRPVWSAIPSNSWASCSYLWCVVWSLSASTEYRASCMLTITVQNWNVSSRSGEALANCYIWLQLLFGDAKRVFGNSLPITKVHRVKPPCEKIIYSMSCC